MPAEEAKFTMVNFPFMFPLFPTQLTRANFTIVNLKRTGHTAKLVYCSFTIVNLTFSVVKYGQWGLYHW